MAERAYANPARVPRGLVILPNNGYDGQFFYRLALNPSNLHRTAYGITFDSNFRVQRIGYPVLAWLVSLGQHQWVPVALIMVNILALTALGFLGGLLAREVNRRRDFGSRACVLRIVASCGTPRVSARYTRSTECSASCAFRPSGHSGCG